LREKKERKKERKKFKLPKREKNKKENKMIRIEAGRMRESLKENCRDL
jgi:hypothetical protein